MASSLIFWAVLLTSARIACRLAAACSGLVSSAILEVVRRNSPAALSPPAEHQSCQSALELLTVGSNRYVSLESAKQISVTILDVLEVRCAYFLLSLQDPAAFGSLR